MRLTFNTHRSSHDLRDPFAVRDCLWAVRLGADVSGAQLDTAERLIIALRESGAVTLSIEVTGTAPNALHAAAQHAAHDRLTSEGGAL